MASSSVNCVSKLDTSRAFAESVGLNGGSILHFSSLSTSMSANQGCLIISLMPSLVPNLFLGSFSKS